MEGNSNHLKLAEDLLNHAPNIHLLSAPDGKRGLDVALLHQPDLILMDLNLPEMDGYRVFQLLKFNPITAHIPVIAVGANGMPGEAEKTRAAGFADYLPKPIDVPRLLDAVQRIPGRGSSASEGEKEG